MALDATADLFAYFFLMLWVVQAFKLLWEALGIEFFLGGESSRMIDVVRKLFFFNGSVNWSCLDLVLMFAFRLTLYDWPSTILYLVCFLLYFSSSLVDYSLAWCIPRDIKNSFSYY